MRALAREPADRFPDAGAMAERSAHGVGTQTPCRPEPLPRQSWPPHHPPASRPSTSRRASRHRPIARRSCRRPPKRKDEGAWWLWLLAVLGVLLLGAIGFLGVQLLGGPSPSPSQTVGVNVPNCDDVALTTLRSQAEDANLTLREEEEASEDVDEGRVIRCEPEAVSEWRRARRSSPSSRPVPARSPFRGCAARPSSRPATRLRALGLSVGSIDREPDQSVPDGSVIRSNPAEGVDVDAGSQVDLVISTGPTPSPTPPRPGPRRRRRRRCRPRCRRRRRRRRPPDAIVRAPRPRGTSSASMADSSAGPRVGHICRDGNRRPDHGRRIDLRIGGSERREAGAGRLLGSLVGPCRLVSPVVESIGDKHVDKDQRREGQHRRQPAAAMRYSIFSNPHPLRERP